MTKATQISFLGILIGYAAALGCKGPPPRVHSVSITGSGSDELFETQAITLRNLGFRSEDSQEIRDVRTLWYSQGRLGARVTEIRSMSLVNISLNDAADSEAIRIFEQFCSVILNNGGAYSDVVVEFAGIEIADLGPACAALATNSLSRPETGRG